MTAAVMLCAVLAQPSMAAADPGGVDTTTTTTTTADKATGALAAGAALSFSGGRQAAGSSGSSAEKPVCTWQAFSAPADTPLDQIGPMGELFAQAEGNDATLYLRFCPTDDGAGITATWVLVPNQVSVEDLISSASNQVSAQVPLPAKDMSPDPAVGGIVNLGLWLAVNDPGQVSITAQVGPVWATVTARFTGTSWDFGNGDSTSCDGVGTPIVDKDDPGQGPCGYTYRWPSAPKFTHTDDLAYHASVTGHWVVTYATSTGSAGSLTPIDRTTPFTYQVREIQTVRVAGDG